MASAVLLPEASQSAHHIDVLFFSLTAASAVDRAARRRADHRLLGALSPRLEGRPLAPADAASPRVRDRLDAGDAARLPGAFRLGGGAGLLAAARAARCDGHPRRRQAVDVEGPASGRAARDRRAARARRSPGRAGDELAGRHPFLLRAGVPHQAGRGAGHDRAAGLPRRSRPARSG